VRETSRSRLPLLDSYILRELVGPFVFSFGAFFMFWAFSIIIASFDFLINQHAPVFLVLRFVVLSMPKSFDLAVPFATLFATLIGLGRLIGDNELIAMRAAGITLARICRTPILFGATAVAVALIFNEYVTPASVILSQRTFFQIVYRTASVPVQPQFFNKDADTGNVFYVGQVSHDGKTMEDVKIFKPGRSGPWTETLLAKTATVDGSSIVLHDVLQTRYNADGYVTAQSHANDISMGLPIGDEAAQFTTQMNQDTSSMSSKQIRAQVQAMQAQGMGGTALGTMQVNLADKLAFPFASLVGVMVALPLAFRFGRRGRTFAVSIAVVVMFVYYLLTSAFTALGRNDALPPVIAAWAPNLIVGLLGIVLFAIEERFEFGTPKVAQTPASRRDP
jgi:LPS export ABC transporter permease LptG